MEIVNWNVDENRLWYAHLWDAGGGVGVSLHYTRDEARSGDNPVAQAISSGYGAELPVLFPYGVEKFIAQYDWHVLVSGQAGDPSVTLEIKPFVDLPEISHKIYANDEIAMNRAAAEIDAHTHASIRHRVPLAVHYPDVEAGHIATISSGRVGAPVTGTITEHKITAQPDRLTSDLEVTSFMEVTK